MNILQLFPGKIWGGAEQYIFDLSTALIKRGHHVYFLAYKRQAVVNRLLEHYQVKTLPFWSAWDLYSAYRIAQIIRSEKIEVIHVHQKKFVPLVYIAKRWSNSSVRIVFTQHDTHSNKVGILHRNAFNTLHAFIFVSKFTQDYWLKSNPWTPQKKCHIVLNSIPPVSSEGGESLRQKYAIATTTPLIVFAGRVRKSKGCSILIDALSRLKDLAFHVVFIGSCKPKDYREKLMKQAFLYNIADRISFYGFSSQVRSLIREADIGVAPSIIREACPLSPLEFMQEGKCVIATHSGGQSEYIFSMVNGILVAPNDVGKLAEVFRMVLVSPDLRKKLGKKAQAYFEEDLNYDKFIERILRCYCE